MKIKNANYFPEITMKTFCVVALALACVLGLATAQFGAGFGGGFGAAPSSGGFGQGGRKFDSVSIS